MILSYYTYRTLYIVNVLANPTTYYGEIYAIFLTYLIYDPESSEVLLSINLIAAIADGRFEGSM